MATDKSLRQHYDNGKIVDPFKKGFETIAGKAADTVKKAKEAITSTAKKSAFTPSPTNLKSKVQSMAKQQMKSRIQSAVLSKLGLSFLNPVLGIASLFGFDPFSMAMSQAKKHGIMQGFAPDSTSFLNPFSTQAAWEANQAAEALGRRKDYMWDRMLKDKPYSEKNLIDVINKIAKITPYQHEAEGYVNQPSAINIAKAKIDMPEHLGLGFEDKPTPVTTAKNPIQMKRDAEQAAKDKAIKEAKIKEKISEAIGKSRGDDDTVTGPTASPGQMSRDAAAARSSALGAMRGGVGRNGGGGYGGDPGGGAAGSPFAHGGRIDRPLPGRNRYL